MDIVTLAMAKAYVDSQRLGYIGTEDKLLIAENDYELSDAYELYGEHIYVGWVGESINSKTPIFDVNAVEVLIVIYENQQFVLHRQIEGLNTVYSSDGREEFFKRETGIIVTVSQATTTDGTPIDSYHNMFLVKDTTISDETVTRRIAFYTLGEVVHQIDPKFIPDGAGGGLPEVTLTTVVGGNSSSYGDLTAEEVEMLSRPDPVLLRVKMQLGPDTLSDFVAVTTATSDGVSYMHGVNFMLNAIMFQVQGEQGFWMVTSVYDMIEDYLRDQGIVPTATTAETDE